MKRPILRVLTLFGLGAFLLLALSPAAVYARDPMISGGSLGAVSGDPEGGDRFDERIYDGGSIWGHVSRAVDDRSDPELPPEIELLEQSVKTLRVFLLHGKLIVIVDLHSSVKMYPILLTR